MSLDDDIGINDADDIKKILKNGLFCREDCQHCQLIKIHNHITDFV